MTQEDAGQKDRPKQRPGGGELGRRAFLKASAAGVLGAFASTVWPVGPAAAAPSLSDALIVYFSHTGVTRYAARQLQKTLGCPIAEIQPKNPYPQGFGPTAERALHEQISHARPEISVDDAPFAANRTVFVGYPIWLTKMPLVMWTYFEGRDFSGKTVIPFCTYERSGLGQTVEDIRTLCPQSKVGEGLALLGGQVAKVETAIARGTMESWLRDNGVIG